MALGTCLICGLSYRPADPRTVFLPPLRIDACLSCRQAIRRMATVYTPFRLTGDVE